MTVSVRATLRCCCEGLEERRFLAAYSIVDLGTLGGIYSRAYSINSSGAIVGEAKTAGGSVHAFLYSAGPMRDLGTLGGSTSAAYGMNDSGQIVGRSLTSTGVERAFLYRNGSLQNLGALPGNLSTRAYAINSAGQVVGDSSASKTYAYLAGTTAGAFLYTGGALKALGFLPGGKRSSAYGINKLGQVVGNASNSAGADRAFLYNASSSGPMKDLGTLPGGTFSHAYGINNAGQVVGESDFAGGAKRAFLYSGGVMRSLGTLGGGDFSHAYAISNAGEVVGQARTSSSALHAFVYSAGAMRDLNSLIDPTSGWTLVEANAINNSGRIVGYGINRAGRTHAFLLKPAPSSISGVLFNDLDGDGIKDLGEPPMGAQRVFLDVDHDGSLDGGERSALTDAAGAYRFMGLAPGPYRVRQSAPTGWRATKPAAGYYDVTLIAGRPASARDFGLSQKVLIQGRIYHDANGDGAYQANEKGLSGWRMFIDSNKNGVLDTGEPNKLTDASGNFSFVSLPAGSYRVREVVPTGWRRIAPSAGYYDVTLAAGKTASGKNFANQPAVSIAELEMSSLFTASAASDVLPGEGLIAPLIVDDAAQR